MACGWIKKRKDKIIKANSGRSRININGALNAETLTVVMRVDDTINTQSTLKLLKTLEEKHPDAENIYVTLDNARYYKNKLIDDYLFTSKIRLLFFPPYSPNLNLIERLWKFMRKEVLYLRYPLIRNEGIPDQCGIKNRISERYISQKLTKVEISTRKVAMCIHEVWPPILSAPTGGVISILKNALQKAVDYLGIVQK